MPRPELEPTNAIVVRTHAEVIRPWLVQMGYHRGGSHTDSTWLDWDCYPNKILRFWFLICGRIALK